MRTRMERRSRRVPHQKSSCCWDDRCVWTKTLYFSLNYRPTGLKSSSTSSYIIFTQPPTSRTVKFRRNNVRIRWSSKQSEKSNLSSFFFAKMVPLHHSTTLHERLTLSNLKKIRRRNIKILKSTPPSSLLHCYDSAPWRKQFTEIYCHLLFPAAHQLSFVCSQRYQKRTKWLNQLAQKVSRQGSRG